MNTTRNELTFSDVLAAQMDALWAPAPRTYRRTCNTCGKTFDSSGPWMCGPCYAASPDPFTAFEHETDEPTAAIPYESMSQLVHGKVAA